jgi:hypothetical protein
MPISREATTTHGTSNMPLLSTKRCPTGGIDLHVPLEKK